MKRIAILVSIFVSVIAVGYAQDETPDSTRTQTLDEVVVQTTAAQTKFVADGIVTTVQGTPLGNVGTGLDVLGYIPGVITQNGTVEVIGRGSPLIYINGRKVRDMSQLQQLRSDKVKEVKLINNPGSSYDASIGAVIKIKTLKDFGEGLALDTRTKFGVRDYFYGNEIASLNYRKNGLDVFAKAQYNNIKSKQSVQSVQEYSNKVNSGSVDMTHTRTHTQFFDGQIGMNWAVSNGHAFGFYYQYDHKPSDSHGVTDSELIENGSVLKRSSNSRNNDEWYNGHLIDGYYTGEWGKWTADLTFDFMWRNNKDNKFILDNQTNVQTFSRDHNRSRMLAAEFSMSRYIGRRGSINLGIDYTSSSRKDSFWTDIQGINDNDNDIKEYNVAAYGELTWMLGRSSVMAGVRYEHTDNRYFENRVKLSDRSRKYDQILPSVTVTIPMGNTMIQTSYSRKYRRPIYAQLSNTVYYVNEYTYETGNPFLKSMLIDNIAVNFRYKWLMLMADWSNKKDMIMTTSVAYNGNPDISLIKKFNSDRDVNSFQVIASIMPGFVGKVYYPILSFGVMTQLYKVENHGELMNLNRPIGIVRLNNMFQFPGNYMLNLNFNWRGKGDSDNVRLNSTWQIDLGLTKTFNYHWDVALNVTDIFNTAAKNGATMYGGVRKMYIEKRGNTRGIELSIGYRFNYTKSKYIGRGAGNSEKERL